MSNANEIILTIAIPTFEREEYLDLNLSQLFKQLNKNNKSLIEIIVSDNCSSDGTSNIVQKYKNNGMDIIYKRNLKNLGWAKNFINSFEMSSGKFILMLGDDDLLVDGALDLIINELQNDDMGVLCITPYGYNESFVAERPHSKESKFL